MSDLVIETSNLAKVFPNGTVAVHGLDLAIERGQVYGLIGQNGAGKTTALRILMGLLNPTSGTARVLGQWLGSASSLLRERIAYVAQGQTLYPWLTLEQFCSHHKYFFSRWDSDYSRRLIKRWNLVPQRLVSEMSGGEQRKVAMVLALAARPEVLLLDEPAAGLDPIARREFVQELVDAIASEERPTILMSTHNIQDLERVADHIGIMDRGRLVSSRSLEELQRTTRRVQVIFDSNEPPPNFRIPGALRTDQSGCVMTAVVRVESETQLDCVRTMPGVRVQEFPLELEETYIAIFGPEIKESAMKEGILK